LDFPTIKKRSRKKKAIQEEKSDTGRKKRYRKKKAIQEEKSDTGSFQEGSRKRSRKDPGKNPSTA
jgi:hypothetical protein